MADHNQLLKDASREELEQALNWLLVRVINLEQAFGALRDDNSGIHGILKTHHDKDCELFNRIMKLKKTRGDSNE